MRKSIVAERTDVLKRGYTFLFFRVIICLINCIVIRQLNKYINKKNRKQIDSKYMVDDRCIKNHKGEICYGSF